MESGEGLKAFRPGELDLQPAVETDGPESLCKLLNCLWGFLLLRRPSVKQINGNFVNSRELFSSGADVILNLSLRLQSACGRERNATGCVWHLFCGTRLDVTVKTDVLFTQKVCDAKGRKHQVVLGLDFSMPSSWWYTAYFKMNYFLNSFGKWGPL